MGNDLCPCSERKGDARPSPRPGGGSQAGPGSCSLPDWLLTATPRSDASIRRCRLGGALIMMENIYTPRRCRVVWTIWREMREACGAHGPATSTVCLTPPGPARGLGQHPRPTPDRGHPASAGPCPPPLGPVWSFIKALFRAQAFQTRPRLARQPRLPGHLGTSLVTSRDRPEVSGANASRFIGV